MDTTTILVVDDDPFFLDMYVMMLEGAYKVITADSGAACLQVLQDNQPDLVLLDVEMRDMSGYEVCQRIKNDLYKPPSVIFVSGMDTVADRLKGYDAGGDDYVTKPIEPRELQAKIASTLKFVASRSQLEQQVAFASTTAMTAMTSMGEMGILLEQLKSLHACRTFISLADTVAKSFELYGLAGVVMLRPLGQQIIRASNGAPSPMEAEAIKHVADMGRIVEFKTRMSISYPLVTLLFNNMPVDDPDRYGRLRDHLAILAEGVEAQVQSLQQDIVIQRVIAKATKALADVDNAQRERHAQTNLAIQSMTDDLERAYLSVALTEDQEKYMATIVSNGIERILKQVSDEVNTQEQLTHIIDELKLLAPR